MKNINSLSALFLVFLFFGCAKEESLLESAQMAPLFQHWALEFDNDVVTGVPHGEKYPDASGLNSGYEFFKNGEGIDYSYTPHAHFTFEVTENGAEKLMVINKSIPTILANDNYHEGTCQNNTSNGSGCNNTENFNAATVYSIEYATEMQSFRIVQLTSNSLQGYMAK